MIRRSWLARLALWFILSVLGLLSLTAAWVALLRIVHPPWSALMMENWVQGQLGHRASSLQHHWSDFADISPDLALAVVASEDQKFPVHRGFDVEAIEKAYTTNPTRRHIRGASTISQQTAKNLFLWPGRSYLRKGLEAYFTVLEEAFWPKRRILEMYLNFAEFGNGVYGAEAAAQRFFHKTARRLSPSESALLAAVLPNPKRLHADAPSRFIESRRAWILGQMQGLGGVSYLRRSLGVDHAALSLRPPARDALLQR